MLKFFMDHHEPLFQKKAIPSLKAVIGKSLLAGIEYFDKQGKNRGREQFFGIIQKVDVENGLQLFDEIRQEIISLPLDLDALNPCKAGVYEVGPARYPAKNPDYEAIWTFTLEDEYFK